MNKAALMGAGLVGVYAAAYGAKYVQNNVGDNELIYFSASEFGVWWPLMNQDVLLKLDLFRSLLGAPVIISSAAGGIGREKQSGQGFDSLHNVLKWGQVRAVDVMLPFSTLQQGYDAARAAGFSGIGVYPDWKPSHGMHLDNRPTRSSDAPALWSGVSVNGSQQYGSISQVVNV